MITVIHGQNNLDSYLRLKEQEKQTPAVNRTAFGRDNTYDDLYQAFYSTSLLEEKTLLIAENFLSDKKIKPTDDILKDTGIEKAVIFWESDQLSPSIAAKLPRTVIVEQFKKQSNLYAILDSIGQNPLTTIKMLHTTAEKDSEYSLIYMLTERIFLLVLAKSDFDVKAAGTLLKRPLAPWQWQKIRVQSAVFSLPILLSLFKGILKIDQMIKTGKTDMPPRTLIDLLFLKYLKTAR